MIVMFGKPLFIMVCGLFFFSCGHFRTRSGGGAQHGRSEDLKTPCTVAKASVPLSCQAFIGIAEHAQEISLAILPCPV
jgi:hypothetical protein